VLSTLFISQTVNAIVKALEPAGAGRGPVAVLGQTRVGRALAERGYRVVFISDKPKSLRRVSGMRIHARPEALPVARQSLAGLVAAGVGQRDDWSHVLGEWSRAVTSGGTIVLVDRAPPAELSRRVLCSGLAEIEQRQAGRTIITSGLVTAHTAGAI
jgi:hypothetical protein